MDAIPSYLIIAIVIVFIAWRAARRQNERIALARMAEQAQHSFNLDEVEDEYIRGFVVVDNDGEEIDIDALNWQDHGLHVAELLSDHRADWSGFTPGMTVELIPPEDGSPGVDVWNRAMSQRAGRVDIPGDVADAAAECIVLQELVDGGQRVGLRLLLMREDMLLEE